MENASKALIIAGAILLSILIIAIGMYIYNSSQSSIMGAGDALSSYEVDSFNAQWDVYAGEQPGSNVKTLLGKLVSNAKTYAEEGSRLPDVAYKAKASDSTFCCVESTAGGSNTNVLGLNKAKNAIEPKHIYTIELVYSTETSLVSGIIIKYAGSDDSLTIDSYVPNEL